MATKRLYPDAVNLTDEEDDPGSNNPLTSTPCLSKKHGGAAKYKVKFKLKWKESYPVRSVAEDAYKFHCIPCERNVSCYHQGLGDVKRHCTRESHKVNEAMSKKQTTLKVSQQDSSDSDSQNGKLLKAEMMVTDFIEHHNLPLATADPLSPDVVNLIDERESQPTSNSASTSTPCLTRKHCGAATYKVKFKLEWEESYPICSVPGNVYKFHCIPCGRNVSCHHQGLGDVRRHCKSDFHEVNEAMSKKETTLKISQQDSSDADSQRSKVLKAEMMVTNFIVQHNLPLAIADRLGPLFKEIFPDSEIAKSYANRRTKTKQL